MSASNAIARVSRKRLATIAAVERAANGEPSLLNMAASAKLVTAPPSHATKAAAAISAATIRRRTRKRERTFMTLADANAIAQRR